MSEFTFIADEDEYDPEYECYDCGSCTPTAEFHGYRDWESGIVDRVECCKCGSDNTGPDGENPDRFDAEEYKEMTKNGDEFSWSWWDRLTDEHAAKDDWGSHFYAWEQIMDKYVEDFASLLTISDKAKIFTAMCNLREWAEKK